MAQSAAAQPPPCRESGAVDSALTDDILNRLDPVEAVLASVLTNEVVQVIVVETLLLQD